MKRFNKKNLPYRDSVACIVYKDFKFLLVQLKGWPKNFWKFPQGGIKEEETEIDAIKRELEEELGTKNFKIITKSFYGNIYDWDNKSIALAGYKWRGQNQKFFLIKFLGNDDEIKINKNELNTFKWLKKEQINKHINHKHKIFKNYKETIKKIIDEFEPYLD